MVAPHAEDRFYEPDWYFGKHSTDITKRFGKQILSHAYDPQIKNAPTPYHVIPYHDMSDKFRNKLLRDRRRRPSEDTYHGRRATEITSPIKFAQEENEVPLLPWPGGSRRIGDMRFSRFEYLHPLGKTRPSPMDDYIPILRDKRTGRVIGNPSPPPSRVESRRRMLGLPPDGCHSPGSPCRSGSPSQHGGANGDEDEEHLEEDLGLHHGHSRPRPHDAYDQAGSPNVGSSQPPTPARSACGDNDAAELKYRPLTAPVQTPEPQKLRRKKSYLSSTFGSHMQPVGGRAQRTHTDGMDDRPYRNDQPESPHSYGADQPEVPQTKYSLGSMSRHAQPVGGRASVINMMDMGQNRQASPRSDYAEISTSYQPPAQTPRNRLYPPQHHSFSQESSRRDRDDEAFSQHKFRSSRDDRSTASSQSSRKLSKPPKYDPNLPPESQRGRSHRRGG